MDKAIAHKRGTGQSSDEDWFAQAKAERRRLGRIIGDLQQQLGQVCRKERANRTVSFERAFVRKAEALLPAICICWYSLPHKQSALSLNKG